MLGGQAVLRTSQGLKDIHDRESRYKLAVLRVLLPLVIRCAPTAAARCVHRHSQHRSYCAMGALMWRVCSGVMQPSVGSTAELYAEPSAFIRALVDARYR